MLGGLLRKAKVRFGSVQLLDEAAAIRLCKLRSLRKADTTPLHSLARSTPSSMAVRSFFSSATRLLSVWNFRPNMSLT